MALATQSSTISTATGTAVLPLTGENATVALIYGTYTGFTCVFEASQDGTLYFPVFAIRSDSQTIEDGTLSPPNSSTRSWILPNGIWSKLRLRATALSTGTVNVVFTSGPGTFPLALPNTPRYFASNVGNATIGLAAGSGAANVVLVASGPGILHSVQVTTAGATAGLILYDNATTNSGVQLYQSAATYALGTQTLLNVVFQNGITARQASTTAACTLSYRLF